MRGFLDDDEVAETDIEQVDDGQTIAEKTQAKAAKAGGATQSRPKARQGQAKTFANAGGATSSLARAER